MLRKINFLVLGCAFIVINSAAAADKDFGNRPMGAQRMGGGIYEHQIYSASSKDSLNWTRDGQLLFDHASVPDAIVTKEGTIFLYFMDASEGHLLAVAKSTDQGKTWQKSSVIINGKERTDAVDPCPVLLDDGRIRLYYFGNFKEMGMRQGPGMQKGGFRNGEFQRGGFRRPPGQFGFRHEQDFPMQKPQGFKQKGDFSLEKGQGPRQREEEDHKFYSAISSDGVHFEEEGICLTDKMITDPDVVKTDTGWKMMVSKGRELLIASSPDGKDFTLSDEILSSQGAVSETIAVDGGYRTYISGGNGIYSQFTKDFEYWKNEGQRLGPESGKIIADPSVIKLPDGTYKMFYKEMPTRGTESQNQQRPEGPGRRFDETAVQEGVEIKVSTQASDSSLSMELKNTWELSQGTHRLEIIQINDHEIMLVVVQPEGEMGRVGMIKHQAYRFDINGWKQIGKPFPVTWVTSDYGDPADHRAVIVNGELVVVYQTLVIKEEFKGRGHQPGPAEPRAKNQSLMLARFTLDGQEILRRPIVAHATDYDEDNFPDFCIVWRGDRLFMSTGMKDGFKIREVSLEGEVLNTHKIHAGWGSSLSSIGNSFLGTDPLQMFSFTGPPSWTLTLTTFDKEFKSVSALKFPTEDREQIFPTGCLKAGGYTYVGYISRSSGGSMDEKQNPYYPYLKILDNQGRVVADIKVGPGVAGHGHPTLLMINDRLFYAFSQRASRGGSMMAPQVVVKEYIKQDNSP